MPEVVADPDGCGHVFGNPMGGSMSLQCFVNGSLAREAVKDKFHFDWDQFTAALEHTDAGNGGQVMLPFFRPEISPRLDRREPLLDGGDAFCDWQEAEAVIRACVEGQFLNMKRCSAWMQLQPDTIYLTGGASKNDAIAQILADVFQVQVQRLAVSGSVALGAAMRAACQSGQATLDELEERFCAPQPRRDANHFATTDHLTEIFQRIDGQGASWLQHNAFDIQHFKHGDTDPIFGNPQHIGQSNTF